jgi:deoxycytidylate deaminase
LKVPSGERHELCRGLHAEQNAIIQAALHGVSVNFNLRWGKGVLGWFWGSY